MNRLAKTFKPKNPNGIFFLGEFAEINDQKRGYHFSGGSGQELKKMCQEVGLNFYEGYHDMVFSIPSHTQFDPSVYCTDWTKQSTFVKPKYQEHVDHVKQAIFESGARVIAALGDLALFILTGEKSVATWRGSCLYCTIHGKQIKVIPTYAPSRVLKVWDWRHIVVADLQRIAAEMGSDVYQIPSYTYHTKPTFAEVTDYLDDCLARMDKAPVPIAHDLETINRYISCSGLAISKTEAMCIPFMTREAEDTPETPHNYWSKAQETAIVYRQNLVLTHKNARVIGQNYLYDMQHIAKTWGIRPNLFMDTMLAWHTVFPGERKSLDYLASRFCDYYVYWKDELKDYNSYPADELVYWTYNGKDCIYTFEIAEKLSELVDAAGQREQFEFQMSMVWPALSAMLRGVRVDLVYRKKLSLELMEVAGALQEKLLAMSGDYHPVGMKTKNPSPWFTSPQQTQSFFYDYLGLPVQRAKVTYRPTTDDNALAKLAELEPIISPIVQSIQELRSVNIFKKNFVDAALGTDQRIRCSYNLAGTETFRLASSKDAFGQGANLQTIPSGNDLGE